MKKMLFLIYSACLILTLCGSSAAVEKGGTQTGTGGIGISLSEQAVGPAERDEHSAALTAGEQSVDVKAVKESKTVIVARVNGAEIDMFMLARAMNRIAPSYLKEGEPSTPEKTEVIRTKALDKLIFEELAVQEATNKGVDPKPEAVDRVIHEVRKNLETEQAYKQYLEANELTESTLKQLIRRSQRLELITAQEVYGRVRVDEGLLRDEYERERDRYRIPEKIAVEDVWFLKGKDDTARKHAGEVLDFIKAKDNQIGKLVLDGTFVSRMIILNKEKYPEIYKAASGINAGEMSGVIDEKDGFHIIKVSKKEAARRATFEEARPTIEPTFLYPAQEQRRQAWENEMRKKAKIEILIDFIPGYKKSEESGQ